VTWKILFQLAGIDHHHYLFPAAIHRFQFLLLLRIYLALDNYSAQFCYLQRRMEHEGRL
jgi:hypothetical protein